MGRYIRGDRRGISLGLRNIRSEELRNVVRGILAKESAADLSADNMNRLGRVPIKGFRFSHDDDSMSLEGD